MSEGAPSTTNTDDENESSADDNSPRQPRQHAEDVYLKALQILTLYNLDDTAAKQALEATRTQDNEDATGWADAAAVWIACMNEVNIEQKAMGKAMQLSLAEAEAQKAQEVPLQQLEDQQLKARYSQSIVFKQIVAHDSSLAQTLWEPPHRQHLIRLLELEMKACKWYPRPGTHSYLEMTGKHLATQLSPANSDFEACTVPSMTATPAALLAQQVQSFEAVLYAMPEESGAAPKCFTELEDPDEDTGVALLPQQTGHVVCVDLV